MLNNKQKTPLK